MPQSPEPTDRRQYLSFSLAGSEYGVGILKVREIIGYMEITAVPQTPGYVKGVINLRGQVIPVVDLRLKFGMNAADVTEETCIIVVEITQSGRKFNTGIIVDRVREVLEPGPFHNDFIVLAVDPAHLHPLLEGEVRAFDDVKAERGG